MSGQDENWRPKVLITRNDVPKEAFEIIGFKCDITICDGVPPTRKEILEKSKGMDGILWANHEPLNAEALDAAGPQLKSISLLSAGYDYADVAEVKRRNISIGYTPAVLNEAVADVAIGLMISAGRRFHEGRLHIENSTWSGGPQWMLGQDIKNSVVGIVGLGEIGQNIAQRLMGFKVAKIIYSGRSEKPEAIKYNASMVSFDKLLEDSDFVIISCPLTKDTKNMFNKDAFKKMKKTSVLVNVARGGIVCQDALVKALTSGTIFAAGLDVMSPEPLPSNHPLMKLKNCVIIPHLGSATTQTRADMATIASHNVIRGIVGEPMFAPIPSECTNFVKGLKIG